MAIKNRSTVYLAFVPPNLVVESGGVTLFQSSYQSIEKFISAVPNQAVRDQLRPKMLRSLTNAFVGQNVSYAIISSRSAGDQPGQNHEQYLSDWKSLPDGMVFPNWMFNTNLFQGRTNILNLVNYTRNRTDVPFPMALPNGTKSNPTPPRAMLPAIAFSPTGQMDLSSSARFSLGLSKAGPLPDFYLGLGEGSVFLPKQANGGYNLGGTMDLIETPKDNYTNSIIRVAGLTGRAKLEKPVLRP